MSAGEQTTLATVGEPKSSIRATTGGGLRLESLDDYWRVAKAIVSSGLAPEGLTKGKSAEAATSAVLIAMQMGAEIGLTPMAAIQTVAVINGRPALWGDGLLGVCQGSGVFDHAAFKETISEAGGTITASCTVRRLPNGEPVTRTFSTADAKQAGLAGKAGPWQQYPRRMLQLRARSYALRDTFADVLRGFRSGEELADEPITVEATAPRPKSLEALAERLAEPVQNEPATFDAEPEPVTQRELV